MLKKRGREDEGLVDSAGPEPKILYQKADPFFHLLGETESLDKIEDEECNASEELISGVMRTLEEEIATTSCSYFGQGSADSVTCDVTNSSGCEEGDSNLYQLLGASDDELGIPPTSPLNWDGQLDFSLPFDSDKNQEINGDWYFENDCVDYFQNLDVGLDVRDFVIVEQDYPATWSMESAH